MHVLLLQVQSENRHQQGDVFLIRRGIAAAEKVLQIPDIPGFYKFQIRDPFSSPSI